MLRELAGMKQHEAEWWMQDRRYEAFQAWRAGDISTEAYDRICAWAVGSYMAYIKAMLLGEIESI